MKNYKPLSLTYVEYEAGDLFGFLMAWFTLLPILYIFCLATLIVFRRDLMTIFYFFGLFINEAINYTLKNVIQQSRPDKNSKTPNVHIGSFTKHGMPSDHAQTMFYFMVFFILVLIFRVHLNANQKLNLFYKSILALGAFAAAFLVSFSRVYLEYHTFEQVFVGVLIGIAFGTGWFYFVHYKLTPHFQYICSWKISEFLMIRDYTYIPNVLLFQYTCDRNESNIRRKKSI